MVEKGGILYRCSQLLGRERFPFGEASVANATTS
jgi:hypothetical protein